jgi:hypothetical protein
MPTTEEDLDYDLEHVFAHGDHREEAKPSTPNPHKRVDSRELSQVGAQFRLPAKQNSIPRPPNIDIYHDEVADILQLSAMGGVAHVSTSTHEQRSAGHIRFKGSPPSVSFSGLPLGSHHYSEEDVAILIYHRDKGKHKTAQEGMRFHFFVPYHPTVLSPISRIIPNPYTPLPPL